MHAPAGQHRAPNSNLYKPVLAAPPAVLLGADDLTSSSSSSSKCKKETDESVIVKLQELANALSTRPCGMRLYRRMANESNVRMPAKRG